MNLWSTTAGKILMTFLISMVPVIELRGAIPIAVANGLNYWVAVAVSIIGNLVPVPFIILFIRKIFELMRKISKKFDGIVTKLEQRAEKKSDVVRKYAFWGLFILVAIPLPGTGAWTGTLAASLLDMDFKSSVLAAMGGVLLAGIIMAIASTGIFNAILAIF